MRNSGPIGGAAGALAQSPGGHQCPAPRLTLAPASANAYCRYLSATQSSTGAIAVLPFYGAPVPRTNAYGEALGLLSLSHFTQAFRAALADASVRGIVIDVDSPGGSVYGVMELADEIYRSRTRKPILAIASSFAASGAYRIASAASEFYVTPGGEVGAIRVYDMHVNLSKGLEQAGIETTLIAAGKFKTEGNPFQRLGVDARAAMQQRVDGYYRAFVAAVASKTSRHDGIGGSHRHGTRTCA